MKKGSAAIYLDSHRPKIDGKCSIKIKITFNRKRKYYATGIDVLPKEFERVMNGKRKTASEKETYVKLNHFLSKAQSILNKLPVFTFDGFEDHFFEHRNTFNSVSFGFEKYIEQLRIEKRIGTALSYDNAKVSLEDFKKDLSFADITPNFLKKYENWMLENGRSITTVGIYLRSLRAVYNVQNIDVSIYPFGSKKGKYSIPTGRNLKKALTLDEISKIYHHRAEPGTTKEMAKDYWMFLYLCNGINVKDLCLLKYSNIKGDMLIYQREKTKRTLKKNKSISVALKPETWDIIKKWGQPAIAQDAYIFPHLKSGMTETKKRKVVSQLVKTLNKYMKEIAKELSIDKLVTTYVARHSFATVLKRSGANTAMISELLGHSSVNTTESYLDSFEKESIQKETDALTAGFRRVN